MTPLIQSMWKLVPEPHKGAWFDVGDLNTFEFDLDPELITHLPFDNINIAGRGTNGPFVIFAASSGKDQIVAAGFALTPQFVRLPALICRLTPEGNLGVYRRDNTTGSREENLKIVGVIQLLVSRLDTSDMTAYKPEVRQTFTNQRKLAKGKAPSFEWRTVTVKARNPKQESVVTGTHASPRAHERRGHWRVVKDRRVWVKPCRVGDFKKNGLVLHDYKVHHEANNIQKP